MSTMFTIVWISWLGCVHVLLGVLAWGLTPDRAQESPVQRLRHLRQERLRLGRRWKRSIG